MKNYNEAIKKLLSDIENIPDSECFNSSAKSERAYILEKAKRIKYTIDYVGDDFWESPVPGKSEGKSLKILDIGTSPFTFLYGEFFNVKVYSIDLTELMKKRCEANNIIFQKCDLLKEDIPFSDKEFDLIIFTEVFEHIMGPPHLVFDRIRRVLKDDGLLVFSTPNLSSYYNIIKLMLGKSILTPVHALFEKDDRGNWTHNGYGHWRKYTMGELADLLSRYGFKSLKCKYIIKPYLEMSTRNPVKIIKRLLWNTMVAILPHTQFNLILAKKIKA